MNKMNYCYITVGIRTNYFKLACRIQERLAYLNSNYEHFILTDVDTVNKNKDFIQQHNIKYKIIQALNFNTNEKSFYYYTLSKISALLLTDYDLVCNIDADCILKTNLDYLFNDQNSFLESNYAIKLLKSANNKKSLDTTIFLVKPSITEYNKLLAYTILNPTLFVDDQVFNYFYKDNICPEELDLNSFIHVGSAFKPWNITFDKYSAVLFNDLDATDYNKLIDLNLNFIKQYHDELMNLNSLNLQFNIENYIDKLHITRDDNFLGN